jgi:hypothetical protein
MLAMTTVLRHHPAQAASMASTPAFSPIGWTGAGVAAARRQRQQPSKSSVSGDHLHADPVLLEMLGCTSDRSRRPSDAALFDAAVVVILRAAEQTALAAEA